MKSVGQYLTPGSSASTVTSASVMGGNPAQAAYATEYNAVGIKTNLDIPLTQVSSANNVGVTSAVGSSSSQSTAGSVSTSATITNSNSSGYNTGVGYWMGVDSDGVPKLFIGDSSANKLLWDGTDLDIVGNVSLSPVNSVSGGQTGYNTGTGFWLGYANGTYKLSIGNPAGNYLLWDGTNLSINGSTTYTGNLGWSHITDDNAAKPADNATVGADWSTNLSNIPAMLGTPSADGLYLSSTNMGFYKSGVWTAYIDNAGDFYFKGDTNSSIDWNVTTPATLTIKGGILVSGSVATSTLNVALMGWTTDIVFASASASKVSWGSGHIIVQSGTIYSISAGDTGTMSALTYIYLDIAASTTVLQTTTTYSTATGNGKILIAAAQNNSISASVIPFGGSQPVIDGTAQIAPVSITAAAIALGTITGNQIATTTIGAANMVLATLTSAQIAAATITGSNIANNTITSGLVNLAVRGWTQTCAFSVSSATKVAWGAGTFTASDGTAYSISAGDTGTMSAKTYIYLDIGASTTAYQHTTTATTAVGDGKVLVAIAQNDTNEATYFLLNNNSYNIDASNIVSGSITSNEIAASTITGSNIAATTIAAANIVSGTITATQIAAATITGSNIAATTISASNIVANTITASQIAANTITASQIAANTITASQIAANTITASQIAASTITATQMNVSTLSAITADLGSITAGTITLNTSGYIKGGQTAYNTGAGFFLGYSGAAYKFSIGDGTATNSLTWDGSTLLVKGQTFSYEQDFGDGSDGANATLSGTLTRDMFYSSATVTGTLNTAGFRIFCSGTFTVANGGVIQNNGGTGSSGSNGSSGVGGGGGGGGSGTASGSLPGGVAGSGGGKGNYYGSTGGQNGTVGTSVSHSVGVAGVAGIAGGSGSYSAGGGGAAGSVTGTVNSVHSSITGYLFYDGVTQMSLSAGSGGSGGGCGGFQNINSNIFGGGGGGGGGAGGNGGVVWISARSMIVQSGGIVSALGGNGGNAGNGESGNGSGGHTFNAGSGGGGGCGGQGGIIFLKYSSFTNSGSVLVTAGSGGSGGAAGTHTGTGSDGTAGAGGSAGNVGEIIQIQI